MDWWLGISAQAGTFLPLTDPFGPTITPMAYGNVGGSLPLSDIWGIGGSVGYSYAHIVQRFDEAVVLSIDDDPVPTTIRHDRTADIHALFLEPMTYVQLGRFQLYAGLRLGYVVDAPYQQTQEVIEPPGVTINGQSVVVEAEGEYPELQPLTAAVTIGMRTTGQRIGPVRIEPGVNLALGMTTFSETDPVRQLAVGLDLRFRWDPAPERRLRTDTIITTDTVYVETAEAARTDELTIVAVDSNVVDIDDVRVTTIFVNRQLTRYISVPPSTLLTEVHASFIDDRGQAVTSWQIAYRETTNTALYDAPLPCAVRLGRDMPSSRIDAVRRLSQRFSDECLALLDTMTQPPTETISTGIVWKEEVWQPCRVRFDLVAAGDVDVRTWKVLLYNNAGSVVDSIVGAGAPPHHVEHTFTSESVAALRDGAINRYEFVATDVDGGRTVPAAGTLTFHAADADAADTDAAARREWRLIMPWQQVADEDISEPWTEAELEELRSLPPSSTFWQRCTFVRTR